MKAAVVVVALLCATVAVHGINNGLGATPQMGWNSWYDLMCSESMNQTTIIASIDSMVALGLRDAGYRYVNLDDCWCGSRDANGVPVADAVKFPNGIKYLADYAHANGMLFGLYTDRGTQTCGGRPGSLNYESVDAQAYASWGVDYVKEDSCNAPDDPATAFPEYARMRDALNATGRPIFFSLCGWHDWYAPEGAALGNSWRIGQDDTTWAGVKINIDVMTSLAQYSGPTKGWNDPCLMLSTDYTGAQVMTEQQTRAQFNMWSVLAAPMLISGNVREMTAMNLETYLNAEVIAVGQDVLGRQGYRIGGGYLNSTATSVWARELSDGGVALVLLNVGDSAAAVTCDVTCLQQAGFWPKDQFYVRDLWAHQNLGVWTAANGYTSPVLTADGGSQMLRLTKL